LDAERWLTVAREAAVKPIVAA
ncbi:MAG: hypothetical protein QOE98_1905, partial [Gaiellaceae bacterium]|nr:hypothetical protein [Gaiellaceae bacterium]